MLTQPHSLPGIPPQLVCPAGDLNGSQPPQVLLPIQFELPAIINLDTLHCSPEPPTWLVELLKQVQAQSLLDNLQTHYTIPLRVEQADHEPGEVPDLQNLPVGLVYLAASQPEQALKLPFSLLDSLAGQAAAAIQRAEFYQRAQDNLERLQALRSIDIAISSSMDLQVTLSVLLDNAMIHTGADAMALELLQPLSQSLQFAAGRGFRTQPSQNPTGRLPHDLPGQAVLERRFLFVPDLEADPPQVLDLRGSAMGSLSRRSHALFGRRQLLPPEFAEEGIRAAGAIPLVAKGVVKGVLEVFFRRPFLPDPEWKSFLETLAGQAAIAIDTATMFEQVQRANVELANSYEVTLESWSKLLELRGVESPGHAQRLAHQVVELGRRLGWSKQVIANSRRGAFLHDIGLLSIPDHVLLQEGSPSEEEWQLIRLHPQRAHELLQSIDLLRPALEIPLNHHERWDGNGYPRGLGGDHIPAPARLFAILDTWDAMTHDRPWRTAHSASDAKAYLQQQAGEQFDPLLVEVFLDHLSEMKNIVKE
jgi:HD-GYP domain-containing protein (c-di-GMP phosphodiesterase class II)